ncbi:MAG: hypothetical protein JRJ64_14720, partial [Deltaproteobacteria bacterium]|nr:hypothetical protein [Deltaproteobacteria bacterium]
AGATQAAGGATLKSVGDLLADVQSGAVQGVLALGWATAEKLEELAPLVALDGVVSLTSHVGALPASASVVIPVADTFEIHGSFVNGKGLTQAFGPTLSPPGGIEPAWKLGIKDFQELSQGLADAVEAAQ